jgi:RNA polymerase sigma factor (sigma-70 family)
VWFDVLEVAAIAARPVAREYRTWCEFDDLKQSACEYAHRRPDKIREYLYDYDIETREHARREGDVRRQGESAMITFLRRHLERLARKEKASRSGYLTDDEYFYRTSTIESLIKVWGSGDYDLAGQVFDQTEMGGRRTNLISEGNNLLAMVADVDAAMKKIDDRTRLVLVERYVYDVTLKDIASMLDVSPQRVEQLSTRGVRRLVDELGGKNPWGGE